MNGSSGECPEVDQAFPMPTTAKAMIARRPAGMIDPTETAHLRAAGTGGTVREGAGAGGAGMSVSMAGYITQSKGYGRGRSRTAVCANWSGEAAGPWLRTSGA